MTENEREDHVLVDLFGLLGVKCVFVVQPKMLKETYGLCRLVLEMNGQSTEDWLTSFMEANLGRTADAIVAAQPISEILFALAVKAMRGTPLRHHKTVAMTDTHDRRMCIIPGGPDKRRFAELPGNTYGTAFVREAHPEGEFSESIQLNSCSMQHN